MSDRKKKLIGISDLSEMEECWNSTNHDMPKDIKMVGKNINKYNEVKLRAERLLKICER